MAKQQDIPEVKFKSLQNVPEIKFNSLQDIPEVEFKSLQDVPEIEFGSLRSDEGSNPLPVVQLAKGIGEFVTGNLGKLTVEDIPFYGTGKALLQRTGELLSYESEQMTPEERAYTRSVGRAKVGYPELPSKTPLKEHLEKPLSEITGIEPRPDETPLSHALGTLNVMATGIQTTIYPAVEVAAKGTKALTGVDVFQKLGELSGTVASKGLEATGAELTGTEKEEISNVFTQLAFEGVGRGLGRLRAKTPIPEFKSTEHATEFGRKNQNRIPELETIRGDLLKKGDASRKSGDAQSAINLYSQANKVKEAIEAAREPSKLSPLERHQLERQREGLGREEFAKIEGKEIPLGKKETNLSTVLPRTILDVDPRLTNKINEITGKMYDMAINKKLDETTAPEFLENSLYNLYKEGFESGQIKSIIKSIDKKKITDALKKDVEEHNVQLFLNKAEEKGFARAIDELDIDDPITESILSGTIKSEGDVNYNIFKPAHKVKGNRMVEAMQELIFTGNEKAEMEFKAAKKFYDNAIRDARDSRGFFRLFRKDTEVLTYLRDRTPENFKKLTDQEKKLAKITEVFFDNKDVQRVNADGKVLPDYASRIKKRFWENIGDHGLAYALKTAFKESDNKLIAKAVSDLGMKKVGKKISPFSKERTGALTEFTDDLGTILDAYTKTYFVKKNLDKYRALTKTFNNVFAEANMASSQNFLNRYVKSVMGENIDTITPDGLNKVAKTLQVYTSARYLVMNLPAGAVNLIAGIYRNLITMGVDEFALGTLRFFTPKGQSLLKQRHVVEFSEFSGGRSSRQKAVESLKALAFAPTRLGERIIQGQKYLGEMKNYKKLNVAQGEQRSILGGAKSSLRNIDFEGHRKLLEDIASVHGAYRQGLRPDVTKFVITAPMAQFRLWMGAAISSRLNALKGAYNELKGLDPNKLGRKHTKNIRTVVKEAALIGSLIYLYGDDIYDELDNLGGGLQDLYGFMSFTSTARGLENIMPALKTAADVIRLAEAMRAKYIKDEPIKLGKRKESSEITKKTLDLLPLRQFTKKQEELGTKLKGRK